MRDFIEMMEDSAERRMDDMLQPDGSLKCGCGRFFDPRVEGEILSSNPWAIPVCNRCADE